MKTSTTLLSSVLLACSYEPSEDDFPESPPPIDTDDGEPEPESSGPLAARPPIVDRLEVELTSPVPGDPARIFITYRSPPPSDEIAIELDDGRIYPFNDAGEAPDESAGDGVYSALAPVDLPAEADLSARHLERLVGAPPPFRPRFDGRHLVAIEPFDPTPFEQRVGLGSRERLESLVGERIVLFDANEQVPFALPPQPYVPTHDWEKTLLIRDLSVIEDVGRTNVWSNASGTCEMIGNPNGEWSFQTLMEDIANPARTGVDLHDFVTHWILRWNTTHDVRGDVLPASVQGVNELWYDSVFSGWPKLAPGTGNYDDILDMTKAPFRLVAIVNRLDLRRGVAYGGSTGELRFVFEMIDPATCGSRPFNLILEYEVPLGSCEEARDWGTLWYELDSYALGDPDLSAKLSDITTRITTRDVAPGRPNGSALLSLRTNEQFMAWPHYPDRNWDMRAFTLDGDSGYLEPSALDRTPAGPWEVPDATTGEAPIDAFISSNLTAILDGTHWVEPTWNGHAPFQGGHAGYGQVACWISPCTSPGNHTEDRGRWWGTASSGTTRDQRAARHRFSLATCNGCHGREGIDDATVGVSVPLATPDQPFRHVEGHGPGTAATLSRFLTGTHDGCHPSTNLLVPPLGTNDCADGCCPVGDPVHGYESDQVHFADLLRRQADLDALVYSSCLMSLTSDHEPTTH